MLTDGRAIAENTYTEVVSCVTELNLAVNVLDVTY